MHNNLNNILIYIYIYIYIYEAMSNIYIYISGVSKKYAKLIKRNLKLTTIINNMQLFLDCK